MNALFALALATISPARAMEPNRSDISVGLSTGASGYDQTPFSPSEDSLASGADLLAPFSAAPFDQVQQSGLEAEITWVIRHVRVSWGYRRPVSRFGMADTQVTLDDGSAAFTRSLKANEYSLGLGYELPIEASPIVPYAELRGVHSELHTDLATPEGMVRYEGSSFGFQGKGGVLLRFDEHAFIDLHAQRRVLGEPAWSAGLSVGATLF